MTDNYKSQIGQDKYISEVIFNNKKNGYFIELGAADGIILSNTYYFEKELEWNGICIEPNPKYSIDLSNNRNCHKAYAPVYSSSGKTVEFAMVNYGELSGIKSHLGNIGKCKIEKIVILKTKTLTEILDSFNAPKYIDYLSLDTEGTELEILKGLNMNKYTIGYISVEHNYRNSLRHEIAMYLKNNNYLYSRWNKFDDEYIHKNLAEVYMWSNKNTMMTPRSKVDNRKNLLFIGANIMYEIMHYVPKYNTGLFIEALPNLYEKLKENLSKTSIHNTYYKAINALVTSKSGEVYDFNIFSNNGESSSIYEPNEEVWKWADVKVNNKIKLTSTTISDILKKEKWETKKYDLVLDVQGAELEVLKGFEKNSLKNIGRMTIEISTKPYYKGGVLFNELNSFLVSNGFKLISNIRDDHCDVVYQHI